MNFTPHFASYIGRACHACGGTIKGYRVENYGRVDTFCYSCHATNYFFPVSIPQTAAEASTAERSA